MGNASPRRELCDHAEESPPTAAEETQPQSQPPPPLPTASSSSSSSSSRQTRSHSVAILESASSPRRAPPTLSYWSPSASARERSSDLSPSVSPRRMSAVRRSGGCSPSHPNGGSGGGHFLDLRSPTATPTKHLGVSDGGGGGGGDPSGHRRSRGRSMSARKSNELRPHVELSPSKGANGGNGSGGGAGGSVRMRRTSDSVCSVGNLRLTQAQIGLVRKLWANVRAQGENGAGLQILRDHLFFRYPDVRELFASGSVSAGVSAETNYHRRLMAHAEALGTLMDDVVANLEQPEAVREKIRELGKLHAQSRQIVGFKSTYWDRLAEAFNECTLVWCQRGGRSFEAQVAMTSIVMFVTDQLKDGYMDECRRMRRSVYEGAPACPSSNTPSLRAAAASPVPQQQERRRSGEESTIRRSPRHLARD